LDDIDRFQKEIMKGLATVCNSMSVSTPDEYVDRDRK